MRTPIVFLLASLLMPQFVADEEFDNLEPLSDSHSEPSQTACAETSTSSSSTTNSDKRRLCKDVKQRNGTSVHAPDIMAMCSNASLQEKYRPRRPPQLRGRRHTPGQRPPLFWSHKFGNHVEVVQPPYRPFPLSDDTRRVLERLAPHHPDGRRRRRTRGNRTQGFCLKTSGPQNANLSDGETGTETKQQALTESPQLADTNHANDTLANATDGSSVEATNTSNTTESQSPSAEDADAEEPPVGDEQRVLVDYAGKSAGALVIEKSSGWKGTSNLLTNDNDQYAMVPVEEATKSLVIGLSEEILVKQVILSNYERYSSNVKEFQILGSQTMAHWADLGKYTAKPGRFGRQQFDLEDSANWARYLKFRFLTHYGDEHYLTITQISAHGTTMQQGFHEHWEEEQQDEEPVPSSTNEENQTIQHNDTNETSAISNETENAVAVQADEGLTSEEASSVVTADTMSNTSAPNATVGERSDTTTLNARGIENNGYLLYSWMMPVRGMDAGCQWTALASMSVHLRSADVRSACEAIRIAGESISLIQPGRISRSILSSRHEHDHEVKISRTLPSLKVEESRTAANLASLWKQRTPRAKGFSTEIKGRLRRTERVAVGTTKDDANASTAAANESQSASKCSDCGATAEDTVAQEAMLSALAVEEGLALAMLVDRVPSASCLQELNISQYKSRSTQARSSSSGTASSSPTAGGMEPIFKKLTGEIKSLQAALSVHDKFAKDSMVCFQRVLLDLVLQQEKELAAQNRRLENMLNGTFLYQTLLGCLASVWNLLSTTYYYYVSENLFSQASEIRQTALWRETNLWLTQNTSFSSRVGFPLSVLCMLLYRRRYRVSRPKKAV